MLRRVLTVLGLVAVGVLPCSLFAQEAVSRSVSETALAELGEAVADVDNFKDNHFQYEAQVKHLTETAELLQGMTTEVTLEVERVTPYEVIVNIPKLGRMRVVLQHAKPPLFGSLGSRSYNGPPSTIRFQVFAKPIGLRLGDEIDLNLAKQLRDGDRLRVAGRIKQVPIQLKSTFNPYVAAVLVDWKVVAVDLVSAQQAEPISY